MSRKKRAGKGAPRKTQPPQRPASGSEDTTAVAPLPAPAAAAVPPVAEEVRFAPAPAVVEEPPQPSLVEPPVSAVVEAPPPAVVQEPLPPVAVVHEPLPPAAVVQEPPAVVEEEPPAPEPVGDAAVRPRASFASALRPRWRRVDLAVAALLGLLGFAVAVQVRSTQEDGLLASARQEDLVRILDDLSGRSDRLRQEISTLTAAQERLTTGTDRDRAALDEARRRARVLGVLAGTVPAEGRGIVLTLNDPTGEVGADDLLDALEELRDAGAEAVQIEGDEGGPVRVVASTSFLEREGGVEVDGELLRQPYAYTVVGEPATLAAALAIPGGVTDNVEQQGGSVRVERPGTVRVGALRPLDRPRYARPAQGD